MTSFSVCRRLKFSIDVFDKWENSESPHMEAIHNMTENTANEKLRAGFKKSLHEER